MNNEIYESGEDYLETILRLQKQLGQVRSIDIARDLDYSKPSVSRIEHIVSDETVKKIEEKLAVYREHPHPQV